MKVKRIDKVRSVKALLAVFSAIAFYYAFSEGAMIISSSRNVYNDFEYFASKTFSKEEWSKAEKFRDDLIKIGPRGVLIKGTIVYNYKPASTESVSFNSMGFRGREIEKKEEGEYRIAIVGASRIWGNFFPDNKTIPAMIETSLRNRFNNRKISVINLGIEGIDLQRGIATAQLFYEKIKFDSVVFYFGDIDVNFAYVSGNKKWEPFQSEKLMDDETFSNIVKNSYPGRWWQKSRIYNMIVQSVRGETGFSTSEKLTNEEEYFKPLTDYQINTAGDFPKLFVERAENAAKYFAKKGVETILILSPVPQTKNPLSGLEKGIAVNYEKLLPGYNNLVKKCYSGLIEEMNNRNNSFIFYDQSKIFNGITETVFYDGMHLTPSSSAFTADKISNFFADILEKKAQNE